MGPKGRKKREQETARLRNQDSTKQREGRGSLSSFFSYVCRNEDRGITNERHTFNDCASTTCDYEYELRRV
jgi:hypothetical protein